MTIVITRNTDNDNKFVVVMLTKLLMLHNDGNDEVDKNDDDDL